MSSGRVHSAVTMLTAVAASAYLVYTGYHITNHVLPLAAGCLTGLVINPDLDVDNGSISQRTVRRSTGCLIGAAWALLWKPYAILIPHRSPLSHAPLLSTVIRLAYLTLFFHVVWYLLHVTLYIPPLYPHAGLIAVPPWFWPAFAGLAITDALHWLFDRF
jgi:uncharacterized metal-binding protein